MSQKDPLNQVSMTYDSMLKHDDKGRQLYYAAELSPHDMTSPPPSNLPTSSI